MQTVTEIQKPSAQSVQTDKPTLYRILFAISLVHLLNDTMQTVIPAIFPILKESMNLSYLQVGFIAFALNMTSSVMQPLVGLYSDSKPSPYLLPLGMASTFLGMLTLAIAPNYTFIIIAVLLVGLGSSVFHPEASRVAYLAAGSRRGLAQSIFQVGGNSGQSLAPIMTALIFIPLGQFGAIWFTLVAAIAIVIQLRIASWYKNVLQHPLHTENKVDKPPLSLARKKQIRNAMLLLILFVFARSWYHSGITNFYPFYLIHVYGIELKTAQIYLFLFLAAGALGTLSGGSLADRFGKRNIMLFSMIGSTPLALLLPHVSLIWAYPIILVNGFIILSSFSVMVVYAQELVPGKIGTVSGLIIGLAFGMGAIGSAALGGMADLLGLKFIMQFCSWLPLLGLLVLFLPSDQKLKQWAEE